MSGIRGGSPETSILVRALFPSFVRNLRPTLECSLTSKKAFSHTDVFNDMDRTEEKKSSKRKKKKKLTDPPAPDSSSTMLANNTIVILCSTVQSASTFSLSHLIPSKLGGKMEQRIC